MAWPIPDVPAQKIVHEPNYWFWIMILIVMLIAGAISSAFFFAEATYVTILSYGLLPALLIWLCLFGVILNRYEQSVEAGRAWNLETERTKDEWRSWSRRQIAVIGNVLFSPEEKGMEALLGELDKIPAFPHKARPLFNSSYSFAALMKEADLKLELQFPGYRHFLQAIYVFQSPERDDEYHSEAIYQQWDLVPVTTHSLGILEPLYDSRVSHGLILILCLQDWPFRNVGQSSEFISAQLIASSTFARQHSMPVIAGITRIMPLETKEIINELNILFEYIQPDKKNLHYVWLLGETEKSAVEIIQYANRHQWPLPEKRPLHSLDFSFGPPGEMALPISLAMLAEAATITGKDQLLVNYTPQQKGTLCLITRELYE